MFENSEHGSIDDANDPSLQYLKILEGSFVWEARSLYLIAVALPVFLIHRPAGQVVALFVGTLVFLMVRPCIYSHLTYSQMETHLAFS